ncbi:MAG: protealysin inhibitor emfourin [Jatrophihabitantaceae bacterium]
MTTTDPAPPRLSYRRSGGFAGIQTTAEATADELGADAARIAARLLSDPAVGAPTRPPAPSAADQFDYQLTIADGIREQSFQWSDHTVPAEARALIEALNRLAVPTTPS